MHPINEVGLQIEKYIIQLDSFTRRIRSEILYNHLKNNELVSAFFDNLFSNNYRRIIDHKNYNPRIIEHLTNFKLLKNIEATAYFDFFLENLDRPNKIWEIAYNNLPNDLYKLVLLVKFLIKEKLPVEEFEKAIARFIEKGGKFQNYSFDDFEYTIKEMEGTFFVFQTGTDELTDEEYTLVEFQNPSIIDFVDSVIWKKSSG